MPKLKNRKREMFAIEVAAMTPLDRAYVLAGYSDTPWARYNASKLAHVPEVATRIDELQAQFSERSGIRAEYLQRKLLPLVEANPQDLFEPVLDDTGKRIGSRLKHVADLPRDLAAAISKIKCDPETGAVTEIVLGNKVEAGNVLLRSVGGVVEKHEHDIGGIGLRLAAALGRVGSAGQSQIAGTVIEADRASEAKPSLVASSRDDGLPECM
jgi:Terminase small subunit